jgi:hypothetical protein
VRLIMRCEAERGAWLYCCFLILDGWDY